MAYTLEELQRGFRIGEYLIEPLQNRIVRADAEVRVEPRVMDVLACLAQHAGEVVSRETLNRQVWGSVIVTDQAVTNCISELRQHLGDDRAAHRIIETIPKRGYRLTAPVQLVQLSDQASHQASQSTSSPSPPRAVAKSNRHWVVLGGSMLLVIAAVSAALWWRSATPKVSSVAVLKFENASGNGTLDYLGLALPDEVATLLTKSRDLAVRPFGYVDGQDPLAAARARRVDHIVSGRYYVQENGELGLAIEALHVPQERVIWRTRFTAPAGDLLAMRDRIAVSVRQGLLPALGATPGAVSGSTPANVEAYQLYLRSLALPQQPQPTERAIEMLERSVELEPTFAPAWDELGLRYYAIGTWWEVATSARQKSLAAHRRALELDPELLSAARSIVTHRAETGDLEGAYRDARRLLEQFGPGAETHFSLSYVYRFGGLLEDAQRHCEMARDRDPQDPRLRSCGYAYLYAGKLPRVVDFFNLDEGSYFVTWATVLYQLRRNDREAALHFTRQAVEEPTRRLMQPCLEGKSGAALDNEVAEFVKHWLQSDDPEAAYSVAPFLAFCGRSQEALRFIEHSVDHNYCSYPALDLDPIWASLRNSDEFKRIRVKAMACHERFRQMVEGYDVR